MLAGQGLFKRMYCYWFGLSKINLPPKPQLFTLNLTPFNIGPPGKDPGAITGQGYELRSQGPAVLGIDALNINTVKWNLLWGCSLSSGKGLFGLEVFQRNFTGVHFLFLLTSCTIWNGGIDLIVPLERLAFIHRTQESKHPLETKVFAEAQGTLAHERSRTDRGTGRWKKWQKKQQAYQTNFYKSSLFCKQESRFKRNQAHFAKYESEYKRIKNSSTHCKQEQVKQISRWQGSATAKKTLATQQPSQLTVVHCAARATSRM